MQSGGVETLQLRDVPAPRRDPDAEPVEAARGLGEEAPVPRGAKLIRSETSVASTSAQVGATQIERDGCLRALSIGCSVLP